MLYEKVVQKTFRLKSWMVHKLNMDENNYIGIICSCFTMQHDSPTHQQRAHKQ